MKPSLFNLTLAAVAWIWIFVVSCLFMAGAQPTTPKPNRKERS